MQSLWAWKYVDMLSNYNLIHMLLYLNINFKVYQKINSICSMCYYLNNIHMELTHAERIARTISL